MTLRRPRIALGDTSRRGMAFTIDDPAEHCRAGVILREGERITCFRQTEPPIAGESEQSFLPNYIETYRVKLNP